MQTLKEGAVFAGRYRLQRRLSNGAFAQVWHVLDTQIADTPLALKVFIADKALDGFVIELLREEFRTTNIRHPHLLMPVGFDVEGDRPFLVAPLAAGGSLAERLRGAGASPMAEPEAVRLLAQLAGALTWMHRKNYVHLDISSTNILADASGSWQLTDYGLSRIIHNSLGQGNGPHRILHPAYASPERFAAISANPSDDVFALGVLLHECVTGVVPWDGYGGRALTDGAAPLDPGDIFSDEFTELLRNCTTLNPEARPSAAELERWAGAYIPRDIDHIRRDRKARVERERAEEEETRRATEAAIARADAERKARDEALRKVMEATGGGKKGKPRQEEPDDTRREHEALEAIRVQLETERSQLLAARAELESAERQQREEAAERARMEADRIARQQAEREAREAEREAREAAHRAEREAEERRRREAAAAHAREEAERRVQEERRRREERERRAREDEARKVREEAERKAREEAERKTREEAERKTREEAERRVREEKRLREERERHVREEAGRKAREEAERKAREEAERKAREDAERKAREEAERKAREDAERKAREDAERKAREEAERKAREEAERKAREDAERKAHEDAERKAREDAERKAREDAERKAREDAERKAREDAERVARDEYVRSLEEQLKEKQHEQARHRIVRRSVRTGVGVHEAADAAPASVTNRRNSEQDRSAGSLPPASPALPDGAPAISGNGQSGNGNGTGRSNGQPVAGGAHPGRGRSGGIRAVLHRRNGASLPPESGNGKRAANTPDAESRRLAREQAERIAREEAERITREQAERIAREQAERIAREEAERIARETAERIARDAAERIARAEAESRAAVERERIAREAAERKLREREERRERRRLEREEKRKTERTIREDAERKAREEAERKAREEAERNAREEAERKAREEAERKAREEAERKAREEAEHRARAEAERQDRLERERQARERAAREKAERAEAERQARADADRRRREEQERAQKEQHAREEAERRIREEVELRVREERDRLEREQEKLQTIRLRLLEDEHTRTSAIITHLSDPADPSAPPAAVDDAAPLDGESSLPELIDRTRPDVDPADDVLIASTAEGTEHPEEPLAVDGSHGMNTGSGADTMSTDGVAMHRVPADAEADSGRMEDGTEAGSRSDESPEPPAPEPDQAMVARMVAAPVAQDAPCAPPVAESASDASPASAPTVTAEAAVTSDSTDADADPELEAILSSFLQQETALPPLPEELRPAGQDAPVLPGRLVHHDGAASARLVSTTAKAVSADRRDSRHEDVESASAPADDDPGIGGRIGHLLAAAGKVLVPLVVLAAAAWYLFGDAASGSSEIRLRVLIPAGSDVPWIRGLVEGWMRTRGAGTIELGTRDAVTEHRAALGGDSTLVVQLVPAPSGAALASLAAGECDVALTGRLCTREEMNALGSLSSWTGEHALGLSALAVVVHPSSPLDRISIADLASLVSGSSRSWKDLGGRGGDVRMLLPPASSLAADLLSTVLPGITIRTDAEHPSPQEAVTAVASDRLALAIVPLPVPSTVRVLQVGGGMGRWTRPAPESILDGSYPLAGSVYGMIRTAPDPTAAAVEFLRFASSAAGQRLTGEHGGIPLTVSLREGVVDRSAPAEYRDAVRGARKAALDLRLRPGSTELDPRSTRDLTELAAELVRHGSSAVVLGFCEPMGNPSSERLVSAAVADKAARLLRSHGVQVSVESGFGAAMQVVEAGAPGAVERNRRVEVWVR